MDRVSDVFRFRAEAVRLNWASIVGKLRRTERFDPHRAIDPRLIRARTGDIRVTWACSSGLGVPYGPFTVWTRGRSHDELERVELRLSWQTKGGLAFWWGGEQAARVRVQFSVGSTAEPVGLFLFRTLPSLHDAVAAVAVNPTSSSATLDLRTSGATLGLLVNGFHPEVSITRLDRVVNNEGWQPIELVGLPVERDWAGSKYDTSDQGPIDALRAPRDAAAARLARGAPPFGWHPVTEAGRFAPEWSPPDAAALLDEVQKQLIPEVAPLYDGSVPEHEQWNISSSRAVTPPQQGTKQSSLAATADAKPWATLNLPAHSDAFLNLATGFGTAYSLEQLLPEQIGVGNAEFLVTADYREVTPRGTGAAQFAAYAPPGPEHAQTPPPADLAANRGGVIPPPEPDAAWRETVRLSWKLPPSTAGMGVPTESALARYDVAAAQAEALIDRRDPIGWRPLVISADAPKSEPGGDRTSVVDGEADIPLGSGGRQVGYAVAVSDVYGVWSPWRDEEYTGDEPGPEGARLVSVALNTSYAGAPNCPAALELEVATEWLQRRTADIEIAAVFFPMTTPTELPPAGIGPESAAPTGCFRRDLGIAFTGDEPNGVGCAVTPLNREGTAPAVAGSEQGDGGRRYAVRAAVPTLDFGVIRRWGVQLWVRRSLFVGVSPSGWTPDAAHPARTSAASPVPVLALLPALPGVPMASLPDAEGRSHARISWSLPAGASVRRSAVWECAETALRQSVGLSPRAPDTDPPGARLVAIRAAYDALPVARRRSLFRRLSEVDGALRDYDAVLPKGSTDIHLFVVSTMTDSGVESPWPDERAEDAVRAFIAPRLRRPAPPLVRSSPAPDGTLVIELASASPIQVDRFRLLRTRSEVAARRADTMGPAFAEISAGGAPTGLDSVTGDPVYTATWTGAFPESWDVWQVRAIAIPRNTVEVEAVRGLPSDASDVVALSVLPSGPPDLAALVVEADAAHTGITIRTSTSSPARTVPAGDHRVAATVGETEVPSAVLQSLSETALSGPPPGAPTDPVLERGARASGRTPLALWFTRVIAADPVKVAIRVTDPLGRVTERTETVPGWVPPPPLDLTLVDSFVIVGRGVAVTVASGAPVDATPPYELAVRAQQRGGGGGGEWPFPFPWPPRPHRPPWQLFRSLNGSALLPDIPPSGTPTPGGGIQFGWHTADAGARMYDVWIPLRTPMSATISLIAPDGGRISVSLTE